MDSWEYYGVAGSRWRRADLLSVRAVCFFLVRARIGRARRVRAVPDSAAAQLGAALPAVAEWLFVDRGAARAGAARRARAVAAARGEEVGGAARRGAELARLVFSSAVKFAAGARRSRPAEELTHPGTAFQIAAPERSARVLDHFRDAQLALSAVAAPRRRPEARDRHGDARQRRGRGGGIRARVLHLGECELRVVDAQVVLARAAEAQPLLLESA